MMKHENFIRSIRAEHLLVFMSIQTTAKKSFVFQARLQFYIDGKTEILKAGQAHYCPKGHKHGMKNEGTEDLIIFGVVPKQ